jgi:hypothetical protein
MISNILSWFESKLPKMTISVNGKPYLTRCYLFGKDRNWGNIYLHHFHSSDQGLELHNHPWKWGFSIVLSGGYVEERCTDFHHYIFKPKRLNIEVRKIKAGKFNLIKHTHYHRVDLNDETKGAWTLFFAGPRVSSWGFLDRHTCEFRDWTTNPDAIP